MEIRKLSVRNQVTIPKKMVEDMQLKQGDQLVFRKMDSNNYIVSKLDEGRLLTSISIDPVTEYKTNKDGGSNE